MTITPVSIRIAGFEVGSTPAVDVRHYNAVEVDTDDTKWAQDVLNVMNGAPHRFARNVVDTAIVTTHLLTVNGDAPDPDGMTTHTRLWTRTEVQRTLPPTTYTDDQPAATD